jgi:hypothetical protein
MEDEKGTLPVEATPQATPEPAPPEPAPAPARTPDELVEIKARLDEKDKFIGRQTSEIGDLRRQLDYLSGQVAATAERSNEPAVRPSAPTRTPDEFFNRPYENVEQIVEERLRARDTQRQQEEQNRQAYEARANFMDGKEAAMKDDKRLFEGIEDQVSQAVWNAYQGGAINYRSLASPKTWKMAAKMLLLEKDDPSLYERVKPPKIQPTSVTQTETPNARARDYGTVAVEIDEDTRRWGRDQGLTDKQIEEIVHRELVAKSRGKNISNRSYGE